MPDQTTSAPAFTDWRERFLTSFFRHHPVSATFIGVHDHDHRLPDYSARGLEDAANDEQALRRQLAALPEEPLSWAEATDRRLARGWLDIQQWERDSTHFVSGNPSLYIEEAIFGVLSLFLRSFAPIDQRVDAAIDRLEQIPQLLAQAQTSIYAAPAAWIDRALQEAHGTRLFLSEGIDILIQEEEPDAGAALRRAANMADQGVAAFQQFLDGDLRRSATEAYACGVEPLNLLIRSGHQLAIDAAEIERYAEDQLALCQGALEARARQFGASDWRQILGQLGDLHPSPVQYEARFREVWDEARELALANKLLTWPDDYPIRFVPRPRWSQAAAPFLYFLFYRAPAAFDTVTIVDYLLAPLDRSVPAEAQEQFLRSVNDSVIKLNHVVHHGGIGHHVQNWHAYRAASRIGQIAAVDCATRIALFCGGTMAEGWSSYVTGLMDETGYLTPLESFSQLHSRARMAARALVDVRLHTGRLLLSGAAAFYREQVAMSGSAATGEAVKNSMFPGTALMYLMGCDRISALRREVAAIEGTRFTLRSFHDRFLSHGSIPVSLIAEAMLRGAMAPRAHEQDGRA